MNFNFFIYIISIMSYLDLKEDIIHYTNKVEFYHDLCGNACDNDKDYFDYSNILLNAINIRINTVSHLVTNENFYYQWVNTVYKFKKYSQRIISSMHPKNNTFYLDNDDIFDYSEHSEHSIYNELSNEWL
ncbi:MAG: hypothetical protein N2B06_16890 [Clostridium sp.]